MNGITPATLAKTAGILPLLLVSCQNRQEVKPSKPNVIILLADQWRAQSAGYAGDRQVRTPNIDALRNVSVNFNLAVSTMPVCTPYRACMLTGRRPLSNGVFMNDVLLDTSAVTLAKVLAQNGYQTGYIGKWHLDGQQRSAFTPPGPRRQGFQYWKALNCTHEYNHSLYYANDDTTKQYWNGYDAIAQSGDAIRFIRAHASDPKPFFLVLSYGPPHAPYHTAPRKYRDLYDPRNLELPGNVPDSIRERALNDLAGYYAHMTALDDCVGQIWKSLEESGLQDRTILLFTSDHGDLMGSQGYYKKQQPYDESVRVPFLLHYSDPKYGIGSGEKNAMIGTEDIMPTILGLCHVNIPSPVEGKDFTGYLHGGESPKDTMAIIECIQPFGQWRKPVGREYRGIRTTRYTYVRDLNGPWLLFDNLNDPLQMHNRINDPSFARLQSGLDAALLKELAAEKDRFLPGLEYVRLYRYPELDKTETVPYY